MRQFSFTEKQKVFIEENAWSMSSTDIASKLKVSTSMVRQFMVQYGLQPPKEFTHALKGAKKLKPFTQKEDQYIIKNLPHISINKISRHLKRTESYVSDRAKELGLSEYIEMHAKNSRFKNGFVPVNKGKKQSDFMSNEAIEKTKKTRFQKGSVPHNTLQDGAVTVRHDHKKRDGKPYKWIRLAKGKWYPLHQYIYEQKFGKPPRGMCVSFKDGNTLNCQLENLELITRKENLERNSGRGTLSDKYVSRLIVGNNSAQKDIIKLVESDKNLINLKRHQIILRRNIKNHECKSNRKKT